MATKTKITAFPMMTLILLLGCSGYTWPLELYKYINEDGVVVLDSQIPARYVRGGYTVLSADGRVLEVVDRALTSEELIEKEKKDAEEQLHQQEIAAARERDETLMRLYSTPEDVIRARDTKIATIESFIESSLGTLQRLNNQRRLYEASAAEVERAGGTISKENINVIQKVTARIQQTEMEVSNKRLDIAEIKQAYAADLQRVKELYGISSQSDG